jgi:F-type H+-transporting ATPase subunit delta
MRPRESHRRVARRIWLTCLQNGQVQPEALRLAVEALARHPERGGGAVLAALGERLRRYHCLHHARVESAVPLESATQEAVSGLLATGPGRAVSVEFAVDPELVAGIRARIGYTVFDASVRGRIERLGQALLEE